jgi:hypothetical protein
VRLEDTEIVFRVELPVLFVQAEGGAAGAHAAFEHLERAIGPLNGRRFYGWYQGGTYRACVVRRDGDDGRRLGLSEGTLAGGTYARARHHGPFERLHETFRALQQRHSADRTRPDLEEYRRSDEVWALLPVKR